MTFGDEDRGEQPPAPRARPSPNPGTASWGGGSATRRPLVIGLGTMAFSMEDVLLEPYGGQILHLAVNPAPLSSLLKLPLLTNK